MRSVRILTGVAATVLALAVVAPATLAAAPTHPLHLVKDCSTFLGTTPSFCIVSSSGFSQLPAGTKVWYKGPVLQDTLFLSSNVLLDTEHGSTATGYCIFEARLQGDARAPTGLCSFWEGTGALTGFHAIVDVTIDESQEFHWDGVYYYSGRPLTGSMPDRLPRLRAA